MFKQTYENAKEFITEYEKILELKSELETVLLNAKVVNNTWIFPENSDVQSIYNNLLKLMGISQEKAEDFKLSGLKQLRFRLLQLINLNLNLYGFQERLISDWGTYYDDLTVIAELTNMICEGVIARVAGAKAGDPPFFIPTTIKITEEIPPLNYYPPQGY